MKMDSLNMFARATALGTGGTGRALVGDVINLVNARDIGQGKDVYLIIQIDTTVLAAGGASSVQFVLVSDAQAAIATDGTATEHFATASIAKATLVAGYQVCCVKLPLEPPAYEQYLGILQVVSTNAVTAGKINAFLTTDPNAWKANTSAVNA